MSIYQFAPFLDCHICGAQTSLLADHALLSMTLSWGAASFVGLACKSASSGTISSFPYLSIQLWRIQQANTSFTWVLYGWKGLLYNILNLFFSAPNALSTVTLKEECLRLKSSLGFCGLLTSYSLRWYLVPR